MVTHDQSGGKSMWRRFKEYSGGAPELYQAGEQLILRLRTTHAAALSFYSLLYRKDPVNNNLYFFAPRQSRRVHDSSTAAKTVVFDNALIYWQLVFLLFR